jgi:hypothetical protein
MRCSSLRAERDEALRRHGREADAMNKTTTGVRRTLRTLALAAMLAAPAAWAGDVQVRFDVPEPFRVGSHEYAAGVISVQSVMSYNPTTSLLEVWVNGDCLGMMTALRSISEEPPVRTEALFRRDDDGHLVMVGYRMTGRPTGTTFRFLDPTIAPVPEPGPAVAMGSY